MTARLFVSIVAAGILSAAALSPQIIVAQSPAAAVKTTSPGKTYKAPRNIYGQPDLQGFWSNTTYTPLQRPDGITKEFFSKEEAEQVISR